MNAKRLPKILAAGSVLLLASAALLQAQGKKLQLSISPSSISFSAADPDDNPTINAGQTVNVSVESTLRGNQQWHLTLRANGDLIASGSTATIDISNISWTATPTPPFLAGNLAANVSQEAASGWGRYNGIGRFTFVFQNSWDYWAGNYSQTVTFTLSEI